MKIIDKRKEDGYEKKVLHNPKSVKFLRYHNVFDNTIFEKYIRSAKIELQAYGFGTVVIFKKRTCYNTAVTEGFFIRRLSAFDRVMARFKYIYATLQYKDLDMILELQHGFLESEYKALYNTKKG